MKIFNLNSEQQLISQCQKGDTKAQMTLYKKYSRAMYQVSRNIIKDDMRAEEAMQDGFLSAFEKLGEFKAEVTFGAWLKKIVVNKSLDYLKKDKLYDKTESADNLKLIDDEIEVDLTEKIDAVKKAMNELPENYRIILSLYYLEGYDHEEISEILEMSYANSRTMLTRAKSKLATLLN
ncbi:RNA polymerase sigma-70 factor, ECF subfamily [Moheibacter sediminis]|uniref:RNA polymerase sigma-70 factor, ECF subfamily n=2 Tax=Moheibacter sediminis TaxID=1434700 RepID=A0A1W2AZ73_9FLAO|nr:RNA polymerase sigma-70 factor, ECF subfamily [Moheibacter sediminis]